MNVFKKILFSCIPFYCLHYIDIIAEQDINDEIKERLKKESGSGFSESFDYFVSKSGRIDNVNNILKLGGDADARVFLKSKIRPLSLLSNSVEIDLNKNIINASGEEKIDKKQGKRIRTRVEVRINNDRVLFADKFIYNFSSQNGFIHDALFLYKDYVIRCQKARMDYDGTFYGENVFFTACKYVYPSWGFTIKNAVYNKSFILGKGVSFMFLGKEISVPIPFIYFFPEKEKTGFVYPTGIWFDTILGLYFDPGFYFYFGECADILIRVKWYSSGSSEWIIKHRYIKHESYNGNILFVYTFDRNTSYFSDASSVKRPCFESCFLQWENSCNFEIYRNNFKMCFYYDEMRENKQKAEFFVNHSFLKIPFISRIPFTHGYNKNFKTKSERWDFIETSISHTFKFLRIFAFSPSLSFKSTSSNEDIDCYVHDDNDISFDFTDDADDYENGDDEGLVFYGPQNRKKKVNTSTFSSDSWKDYFRKDYWMKVWKQTNTGASISIPFYINLNELKWIEFSLSLDYNVKLYGSFLMKQSGEGAKYVRYDVFFKDKKVAFAHDFNSLLTGSIVSPDFSFTYRDGSLVSSFRIPVGFSYSPSSSVMHDVTKFPASIIKRIPFFEIKQPYEDEEEGQVSIFSHSVFGNVNNYKEGKLTFGFDFYSYFSDVRQKNDVFSFSISGGYDFFADNKKTFKWQNIHINIDAPFFFGFRYSTSINLYKYKEIKCEDKKGKRMEIINDNVANLVGGAGLNDNVKKFRKTGTLFWDRDTDSHHFFMGKNFLFHRFAFSFPLSSMSSRSPSRDADGYSRFHILNTFYLSISYNFTYAYNPVRDVTVTFHSCVLNFHAKLTKRWEFFSNIRLKKKNGEDVEYSNSCLGIRRVLCDCWMLYIYISYDKNQMFQKKDFRCVISLRPLDPNISIFEQRRIVSVGV